MKKKHLVAFTIFYSSLNILNGDDLQIAKNFLEFKNISSKIVSTEELKNIDNNSVIGTIFYLNGGGYLIIPKSRSSAPIKTYSTKGNIAEPYLKFLKIQLAQVMKFHEYPKFGNGVIEANLSISGTGLERYEIFERNL
jgi:hypothetical protein